MVQPAPIIDLTDEEGLLVADFAEYEPQGVRALLAALNLQLAGRVETPPAPEFNMAVYRATLDLHLATLFGSAR